MNLYDIMAYGSPLDNLCATAPAFTFVFLPI